MPLSGAVIGGGPTAIGCTTKAYLSKAATALAIEVITLAMRWCGRFTDTVVSAVQLQGVGWDIFKRSKAYFTRERSPM